MLLFVKSQISAFLSSLVDFLATVIAVELFFIGYVEATIIGAVCGAVANFILGRFWVFQAQGGKTKSQVFLYLLVWLGSLSLNAFGMYLFTDVWGIQYIFSKLVISALVGICYNYSLQKRVVFKTV